MLCAIFVSVLLAVASARKGGKVDMSQVVNPDPDAAKVRSHEFNPGFLEGDIAGGADPSNAEDRNAISIQSMLWPQGIVPYVIDDSVPDTSSFVAFFTYTMREKIQAAIDDFTENTCIKFVERTDEKDYVLINSQESGCYAYLGRFGGEQPLNLDTSGCFAKGTIVHEMLHTIGFAHEQSRNDRDEYITVNWDNIEDENQSQFWKMPKNEENNQGLTYDYSSVMHYPDWGFSKNGKPVITTKDPKMQSVIGQRGGFSKQDIEEVNKLYKCQDGVSGIGGENGKH